VAGIHGLHAFVAGRFDDADRLFTESFEMGLETGHPVAFVVYAAQLGSLRLFQGRYRELDGLLAGARALAPGLDAFRGALGVSLAEAGHLSEARAVLDEIAADNFAGLRHSSVWLDGMALCARLCSRLGDADRGRQVARELRPYLGKFVADGPVCLGPVEHYLGLALHAAGETAEAIELLRGAVTLTNELATPGFCTWARLDLARMLLATGQAGNVTQAQELLTTVIADGASLGMVATVREANELAERLVRAALPTSLAAHGPAADLPSRAPARSALDASWARARAGHRELVLITGANGAGRSSLASRTAAAAYESGAAVFAGRCDDRSRVSLAPFREMFADAAAGGTLDVDDVHADVARLVGGPGINDGMPFGSTVDVMLDDALENHRAVFLDNVVSCLQHMAGLRPLVLVVEGLDRSDRATLLTLERLLRRASSPGLLVMGTATNLDKVSGVLGADIATLAAGEEVTVTEVAVPSVTVEDAEAMLRFRRPHDSAGRIAELAGALVPGCGGCASALGMLVDEQVVTGGLASGPADVVAARLTRLGAFGLEAFVAGAVAGQRFSVTVVEHMLGRADGTLSAQFRQAEQLGLLVAEPSAPGRFRFVSTQVRARAVASLSAAERARLHRQACRAIEAVVPPAELTAHADELAHHYRLGGSPVGGERAASWLVTAGEVACRVHSYELAERLWEEALDLLDHSAPDRHARRAQLLALLGRLRLVLGGDPVGALALSREALALYERAGETRRAAIVRAHLGLVQGSSTHRAVADVDSALHHFAAADVTLGSADESVADAFHLNWAYAALRGLRLEDAGTHARHAEQGAIRRRDPVLAGRSQVLEALVDWERGELDDAAARIESVAGQTVVYPVLARLACWARSYTLVISGDPLAGLAWADRALTIPGLEDTPMARRWLQEARYRCLWDLGRLQDLPADWYGSWPGATAVRGAVDGESLLFLMDRLGASGDRLTQVAFAAPTASFLRRRNPARARVLLHDALSFATAAEARTLEYLVRVELAIVDPADGRTHLDAARRLVGDGRSWVPLVSGLDHAEAVVRAHGGDGAGAEAAYARAMEAQRALGRPWDELATLLDRAASRGQAGDGEGSAADRIRAIVLVRSLGGDASWVG
jgi:tetratricopeptide (TPR) repeat protein